jgi:putative nucleotidyltransferase with HDIG domain
MTVRVLYSLQGALLACSLTGAVATSHSADWHPFGLFVGLTALMLISEAFAVNTKWLRLSGGFTASVLAMTLLGPAPAVAMQLITVGVDATRRPLAWTLRLANLAAFTTYPLVGGLLVRALDLRGTEDQLTFGLGVLVVFMVANAVNFTLIAGPYRITHGVSFLGQIRTMFVPMMPAAMLAAALTVVIAITYRWVGPLALAALVAVLFVFQLLTRELVLSQARGEELQNRTNQLASLQVGLLTAMVHTLTLRDRMTARHSAAVARYSRAIAKELGCTDVEIELVHTAGLLHDIGKFAFPDSILLASRKLDPADWELIRAHPQHGADLVRRIDGYGPVADIVLSHHERIDGRGYPHGLTGEEIPLLSRIIAVADTYDVMTARDSYRSPVSRNAAIAELRRVAGQQLDAEVVETFIAVLAQNDLRFQHTTDADFELELDFERRVRGHAAPQPGRLAA